MKKIVRPLAISSLTLSVLAILLAWLFLANLVHTNISGATFAERVTNAPMVYTAMFGGTAALCAAFIAFSASLIKIIQDFHLASIEREDRIHNALLLAEHMGRKMLPIIDKVIMRVTATEIYEITDDDEVQIEIKDPSFFRVETPPQLEKFWDSLGIMPRHVANALREATLHLEQSQSKVDWVLKYKDQSVSCVVQRDPLLDELENLKVATEALVNSAKKCLG